MAKQEISVADLDFLTEGSVFTREDGRESRFLFLTNQSLSQKLKTQFPPQVIYADENNNVLSCSIERFLNKRKFVSVDPELEARLVNLLAATSSSQEDTLDLDGDDDTLTIDDGSSSVFDAMIDSEDDELTDIEDVDPTDPRDILESVAQDEQEITANLVTFLPINPDLPAFLTADQLGAAVTSYQQGPGNAPGTIQHTLFIREDEGVTSKTLYASFSPKNTETNVTYDFQIEIEGREIVANWDTFVGIYPCIFYGARMFQVVFQTAPGSAAVVTPVAPAAPAVVAEISAEDAAADAELAEIEERDHTPAASPTVQVTAQ